MRSVTPAGLEGLAKAALSEGHASFAYADEKQAAALGLPEKTDGRGLLIFKTRHGDRVTAACERSLVAALQERERGCRASTAF